MTEFYCQLAELEKSCHPVLATVIDGPKAGTKAVLACGEYVNSPDEEAVWDSLKPILEQVNKPMLLPETEPRIFAEPLIGSPKLIICGGGHISLPVAIMAKLCDFEVTVIDDREIFANRQRFSTADNVYCEDFASGLAKVPDDINNYYVIVTRGHEFDRVCLNHILKHPHTYVGMIGSRSRVKMVKEVMLADGFSEQDLAAIHSPIGLNIGAESPAEIAVCILAEMIQIKNAFSAGGGFVQIVHDCLMDKDGSVGKKALATLVSRCGSTPRQPGTKMVVLSDGTMIGTVGGGKVEALAQAAAVRTITDGKCRNLVLDMEGKTVTDQSEVVGGWVEVFIEPVR